MSSLAGKVVVITGAGSGIGRATALMFASERAVVHAVDIDPDSVRAVTVEIVDSGGSATAHRVDCAEPSEMERLARTVLSAHGHVQILVNNAGLCIAGPAERLALEDWRHAFEVNLLGAVHGVHYFAPGMLEAGAGHIVNVASVAGLIGFPLLGPYVASKFALVGLSECLDAELGARGVHVTVICPSAVRTNILENSRLDLPGDWTARVARWFERRADTPERVAREILAAVHRSGGLRTRLGLAMEAAWMVKRLSPGLYHRLARSLTRRALSRAD